MVDRLYETIGGNRIIWAATEAFYRRVLEDPTLRPFFESVDMRHLQNRQSMFVSMLLGGEVVYTGKDIGNAHSAARLQGLTSAHFDAFLSHFREALNEVGVNAETCEKVMKLLESRRDIVLNGSEGKTATGNSA